MVKSKTRKRLRNATVPRPRIRTVVARAPARRVKVASTPALDPFMHCVFGPVSESGKTGIPDGHPEPTVVIEHRQSVVLKPSTNNKISFALVSSPDGAIGLGEGVASSVFNTVVFDVPSSTYVYQGPNTANFSTIMSGPTAGGNSYDYPVIPFHERLRTSGPVDDNGANGLQPNKFRVATTVAKVTFTGAALTNQGQACTARVGHDFNEDVLNPTHANATTTFSLLNRGAKLVQMPPTGFGEASQIPGSRTFAARESVGLINVPTCYDFQPIRETWAPFYQQNQKYVSGSGLDIGQSVAIFPVIARYPASAFSPEPISGLGFAPVTYYFAEGLDTTASLTVEVRTCVEYTLGHASPMARFARETPIARPLALNMVKDVGRKAPSSVPASETFDTGGWLSTAANWYGNAMRNVVGNSWQIAGAALNATGMPLLSQFGNLAIAAGRGLARQSQPVKSL